MSKVHKIKISVRYADKKISGLKPFELRKNDRGYSVGDYILYEVVTDNGAPVPTHPLRARAYLIAYLLSDVDGLQPGYCVFYDYSMPTDMADIIHEFAGG